jgi:iron complex outermembrane receptor protein
VIVTGSNIPSAEEVGPNPEKIIDREYIDKSGERTLEQLLRDLPAAGANGVPTSNNAASSARGGSSISLRGFDASATLVLIDGRRVAPYPVGTGDTGTQTFIDLNTIPSPAVESVEVLTDGASVIYGADAVAGVVNIKLRHDYRGAEGFSEYGNTLDKDNGEFASSLLFGTGNGNTNVSGVLNYYHRNAIFNRDRGFSNYSQRASGFKSSSSNPGQFEVFPEAVLAAGVPPDQIPDPIPDRPMFTARPPNGTNGLAPATDYLYYHGRQQLFNTNAFSGSFPDSERYGGFVNFDHKIFGEQLVAYGGVFYQNVREVNQLAPAPAGPFQAQGQVTIAIPPHAPGATVGGPSYGDTGVPVGAFNPFNPFQQIISGNSRYRLADFPNRILVDTTDAFMTTAGLRGEKLFGGSWGYDAAFRYSEIKDTATGVGVSSTRFNRILNAADPIFDPASSEFIGTTVPYNPFGDYRVRIPSNLQTINFASAQTKDIDSSKMWTIDFTAYTTSLFKLPGGPVGFAFGGQFRRENIAQSPDELELLGDLIGQGGAASLTVAGRKSFGIYSEVDVPFFSPEMKVPGLRSLEFTAAARFEDYLNNNTNILVPKVGMRWQPFDESLTIRATWGEGFREPSLLELHQSPIVGFLDHLRNPRTHQFDDGVGLTLSSNPNLYPEDSRNFTAGIVYTPKFFSGLTVSVDLFGIERHGVVAQPIAQDVIKRDTRGRSLPGEVVVYAADNTLLQIRFPFENEGQERARGADFGLQYELGTSFGKFSSLVQATYLESFRIADTATSPALENRGRGDYLKWKGRSRFGWDWKGFDLSTTITYLDGSHENFFTSDGKKEHWIQQTFFFDMQASYAFKFAASVETVPVAGYSVSEKEAEHANETQTPLASAGVGLPVWKKCLNNSTVTIGCNDVFGQDPPFSFNSGVNYPGSYDAVGRFVYVSLRKKF